MADRGKTAYTPLRVDPFHSDDSRDAMLRRVRDLAARPDLRAGGRAAGGTTDQTGRFSYLFPELAADPSNTLPTDGTGDMLASVLTGLTALAQDMNAVSGDSTIPAGMTYLGQFIDHDITFDPLSSLARQNDPTAVGNFRTPGLNLDSLYGGGPHITPYQYDGDKLRPGGRTPGRDLPRAIQTGTAEGDQPGKARAVIGDPRNDENLVVAQLHCAFLAFHNKVVDVVTAEGTTPPERVFAEAARRVRWHYQWVVANEFLPAVVRADVLADVKANGGRFYAPTAAAVTMPVEFSMAAYRFGHSMVRDNYDFNDNFHAATLTDLFTFTGSVIPGVWEKAEWQSFFRFGAHVPENFAHLIDAKIASFMHSVPTPGGPVSVPANNLRRGYAFSLPTGQAVAREMGVVPLTAAEVSQGGGGGVLPAFAANPVFKVRTPLWYYILKEAEVREAGATLGEVGSRIVAEVFYGLLRADRSSFLNSPVGETWTPTLPKLADGTAAGDFRIADLIVYAGHAAPDGTPT